MYFLKNADFSAIAILRRLMCCSNAFYVQFFLKFPLVCRSFGFLGVILECFFLMIFQQVVRNLFFFGSLEGCCPDLPLYYYSVSCFKIRIYLDVF